MRFYFVLLLCIVSITRSFAQAYTLMGSAKANGTDCYQLTQALSDQTGAIWHKDKINLAENVDIEFLMNFGSLNENGADGLVFIMQTVGSDALGNGGSELGFAGFSPSLGIEFDTFQNNSPGTNQYGDPSFDHIAVLSNGSVNHNQPSSLTRPVQALADNPNIEDGRDHVVRISWKPAIQQLEVYVDCQRRLRLVNDIVNSIFRGQTDVYWGVSGATGQYTNTQTVCLADQILFRNAYTVCPGESTTLVGRIAGDNVYRWVPADGLDNPASRSPTVSPLQSTTYVVTYRNYCGATVQDTIQVAVPSTCTPISFYVPDAFSPNRDGVNDRFIPLPSDRSLLDYSFTVYSRWGDVLFMANELQQGWDGTYQGVLCSEGVYAYKVTWSYSTDIGLIHDEKQGPLLLTR